MLIRLLPTQRDKTSTLQHSADLPVRGTEAERSEAQEAEARKEALKSLAVHDPYTILPLPVFHYDRNESYWVGAVLTIRLPNEQLIEVPEAVVR